MGKFLEKIKNLFKCKKKCEQTPKQEEPKAEEKKQK